MALEASDAKSGNPQLFILSVKVGGKSYHILPQSNQFYYERNFACGWKIGGRLDGGGEKRKWFDESPVESEKMDTCTIIGQRYTLTDCAKDYATGYSAHKYKALVRDVI